MRIFRPGNPEKQRGKEKESRYSVEWANVEIRLKRLILKNEEVKVKLNSVVWF